MSVRRIEEGRRPVTMDKMTRPEETHGIKPPAATNPSKPRPPAGPGAVATDK